MYNEQIEEEIKCNRDKRLWGTRTKRSFTERLLHPTVDVMVTLDQPIVFILYT